MREPITYKYVAPGSEEFQKLQLFAGSFDHELIAHPKINIYSHNRGDICIGYAEHVYIPVIYPAFHPMTTKPRDVTQVLTDYRAHIGLTGGLAQIGVPLQADRPNFDNSIMDKLGLVPMNREVFSLKL
jgi:hypothetical protein